MPDEPVVPNADASELERLRKSNSELVARHARDKEQLATLQTGSESLQTKLKETSDSLYRATVGVPLQAMAESMSTVPDLFLEQFGKYFKVEMAKNLLTVFTQDGKPAVDKSGKAVPFERDALTRLLTEGEDARAKVFKTFTITNRASGSAGGAESKRNSTPTSKPQFGLGLKV